MSSPFSALRLAGRFKVMVPMRSTTSVRITGSASPGVGSESAATVSSPRLLALIQYTLKSGASLGESQPGEALMDHDDRLGFLGPLAGLRVLDLSNSLAG